MVYGHLTRARYFLDNLVEKVNAKKIDLLCIMEPHGQSPWYLAQRHVGRHSGHMMAHSSTAKGRGLLLPE